MPTLSDGVVVLRAHRDSDVERIVEQSNDPASIRWTTVPVPYAASDAREWITGIGKAWESASGNRFWAIASREDPDTFMGTIDLRPKGAGIAEIGYGLHPEGRGRRLMTSAVRLAVRWWFAGGGVRVVWEANRGNFASWRVAHACGFTFHGTFPEWLPRRDGALDGYVASVGRDDDLSTPRTPWREAPVIESDTLRLRPWREDDAPAAPERDDTPAHFVPPGAIPTVASFDDWLRSRREQAMTGRTLWWCIADPDSDAALGAALLIFQGQPEGSAEIGYFLFPDARGRGLASAATQLLCAYAFDSPDAGGLGMRRIGAVTAGDNDASSRVLERAGFSEWGREPQASARSDGTYDDARRWVRFPT